MKYETKMFKINIEDIAEKLVEQGFSSKDQDKFVDRAVELILDEYLLLDGIQEYMEKIEKANNRYLREEF
jgi:hypothetical protein